LVGTLAHPLNCAQVDPQQRRVIRGYGLLQPRVSFLFRTRLRSRFARIFAGSVGIDPYSAAVSNVYQDLFGEGSYTGKGIYDVDAFQAATTWAFPDNCILSHDLIESNFARCGLATDIELLDDFPAKYHAYARREHRWARGDWQLLPWLGPTVPVAPCGTALPSRPDGSGEPSYVPNPLTLLGRWKILDNLRRTLVPPTLVALLLVGWTVLPGSAWGWTALAILVLALPLLGQFAGALWDVLTSGAVRPVLRGAA
jgi:cyclic beta-1,2-glucan synthetase